jgi:hypothetical protein
LIILATIALNESRTGCVSDIVDRIVLGDSSEFVHALTRGPYLIDTAARFLYAV